MLTALAQAVSASGQDLYCAARVLRELAPTKGYDDFLKRSFVTREGGAMVAGALRYGANASLTAIANLLRFGGTGFSMSKLDIAYAIRYGADATDNEAAFALKYGADASHSELSSALVSIGLSLDRTVKAMKEGVGEGLDNIALSLAQIPVEPARIAKAIIEGIGADDASITGALMRGAGVGYNHVDTAHGHMVCHKIHFGYGKPECKHADYSNLAKALEAGIGADARRISKALYANGASYSQIASALRNGIHVLNNDIVDALRFAGANDTNIVVALNDERYDMATEPPEVKRVLPGIESDVRALQAFKYLSGDYIVAAPDTPGSHARALANDPLTAKLRDSYAAAVGSMLRDAKKK